MPHIVIEATDMNMNMQMLLLTCRVQFSKAYFKSTKSEAKLEELKAKLEQVVEEYFPDAIGGAYCMSNDEFNRSFNGH